MCGIAGWIDWTRDLMSGEQEIEAMIRTLDHRGPDGGGRWLSLHAALAHRRLAIIDPQGGAQPMTVTWQGRTVAIVYNGEIYNFRELRATLETHGHHFITKSDTEVLLHAYVHWGDAFVEQLNGIFAFGLWDEELQKLLLARDPLGVKPLYWAERDGSVLFASEIKALLANNRVRAEVDGDGLAEIFGAGPIRTPGFAIYRGIEELRPGRLRVFSKSGQAESAYWKLRSAPHTDSLDVTTERIRGLLDSAVRRQLISDVPVAAMLSGGLDSSGLTALAARELKASGTTLHTYGVDFEGSALNFKSDSVQSSLDAPWARRVAEALGTQHHSVVLNTPALLENLTASTLAHDVPGLGQLDSSLLLLCRAMKETAGVALSGEGADEIFGGYAWCYSPDVLEFAGFPWMVTLGSAAAGQYSYFWLSPEMQQRASPMAYIQRRYQEVLAEVPRLDGEDVVSAKRREITYLTLTHWLAMLLDRKDRMSMAAGFEIRVPFCDHELVQYLWNVPWEMKATGDSEKGLLRRVFSGLLPEDVVQRRKSAYPVSYDPAYVMGIRKWALDILATPNAKVLPFLNVPAVRGIAAGKIPGVPARFSVVMLERLIQLETWFTTYGVSVS